MHLESDLVGSVGAVVASGGASLGLVKMWHRVHQEWVGAPLDQQCLVSQNDWNHRFDHGQAW